MVTPLDPANPPKPTGDIIVNGTVVIPSKKNKLYDHQTPREIEDLIAKKQKELGETVK